VRLIGLDVGAEEAEEGEEGEPADVADVGLGVCYGRGSSKVQRLRTRR